MSELPIVPDEFVEAAWRGVNALGYLEPNYSTSRDFAQAALQAVMPLVERMVAERVRAARDEAYAEANRVLAEEREWASNGMRAARDEALEEARAAVARLYSPESKQGGDDDLPTEYDGAIADAEVVIAHLRNGKREDAERWIAQVREQRVAELREAQS